jgi:pimeloyl-ACP methyl ester carboxylesterase
VAAFVLVPAAWCGGWVWNKVSPILEKAGHKVHGVTYTGLGNRFDPSSGDIGIETHILDAMNLLVFEDLINVTLVGWSYGGMVIAPLADRAPQRVKQVVFLDSAVPLDGQSLYDTFPDGQEDRSYFEARAEAAGTPGWLPFDPAGIDAQIPDEMDREWFLSKVVPHPLNSFAQPVHIRDPSLSAFEKFYIQCVKGVEPLESDAPFVARAKTEPGWQYRALDANHLVPVSAPHDLADVLLGFV